MNKRIKKKLLKRNNHFHYSKYRYFQKVENILVSKYGDDILEKIYEGNKESYKRNMIMITETKNHIPIDAKPFFGVYPSGVSSGERLSTSEPLTSFTFDIDGGITYE